MKKNNEVLYDQIEQYLSGRLSDAESAVLRQALLDDADLAQAVELRRLEFEVSEALIAQRIRDQMQCLRSDPPPDTGQNVPGQKTRARQFKVPAWVIAAMLIIAAIGIYWWVVRIPGPASPAPASQPAGPSPPVDTSPSSPQVNHTPVQVPPQTVPNAQPARHLAMALSLYHDPDFETLRGAEMPDDPFGAAQSAWQKKDWAAVLTALRNVTTSDPQFIRTQAFRAHAQFKLKRFGQAAHTFAAVSDSRIQPWAEEADWYLLLAGLADGRADTVDFRSRLDRLLSDAGHPYFAEAGALKKQLAK